MSDVPIADHAFLSDARTAALVTRDGSVDWLCLPRFDSAPVFARLLDEGAGHLRLRPTDPSATATWRYLPQSLVLETTWRCRGGTLVVRDALAFGSRERGHDLGRTAPGVLLRHARCTDGEVQVELEWAPRPEFGLVHPRLVVTEGGVVSDGGSTRLVLSTVVPLTVHGSVARGTAVVGPARDSGVALEQFDAWEEPPRAWRTRQIRRRIADAHTAWRSWSDLHQRYRGPLQDLVHRSGLVLHGLTYAHTGAIVAAPTTSLPEGVGTGRTWDYRYTWVRDASMTLRGLWVAACPLEGGRFFDFLARAVETQLQRGLPLQIMFGVGGEQDLSERSLPHLAGWRSSQPVRVGNDAWRQEQRDVYGALLDAAFVLREQLGTLAAPTRALLVAAVETAATTWQEPDQGIWEIRGPAARYTYSAVMCWVALDRGIAMAEDLGAGNRVRAWTDTRGQIRSAVLGEGWNAEVGAFTQTLGGTALDATSLLIGLTGLLAPDDIRTLSTIDAVTAGLTDDLGLVQRYRGDDGLPGAEGSFLLCTFWLAQALAAAGRVDDAERVLRGAAGHASDLGLMAEEVDSRTGEQLGNFPQAFSHLGFVLAAQALADATAAR